MNMAFLAAVCSLYFAGVNVPPAALADGPVTVPFDLLKTQHMVVNIKVNGKGPYRVIFDTGAPVMLLNTKVAKESGLVDKTTKPSMFNPFGSMGQMKIKSLEIGELKAADVATVVMDHPTVELISKRLGPVEGIVGFPFFARYKMTIDYQTKQLTFAPSGYDPPDAIQALMARVMAIGSAKGHTRVVAPAAQWGLVLEGRKEGPAGVVVKEVRPGSSAEQAGIRAGDLILTLDGRWTDTVADAFLAASYVKPQAQANITVQRGADKLDLVVQPRAGL
jgi:hypothetical protein